MASFRKRGSTWEYRIRFTDPQTGKRKEKTQGGFQSKKNPRSLLVKLKKRFS